ncbi:hypothetical protein BSKO_14096 [Bryopsis sp. KO-2023]|nr:hypothetical protein BSKO_14096 [Bryopsis sp. KO-2023]
MSSEDLGLLQAGLTALSQTPVAFTAAGASVSKMHRWLVAQGPVSRRGPGDPSKKPHHGMHVHVHVKTIAGRTHEVSCDEGTTIEELKNDLEAVTGYSPHQQRLMFAGEHLTEDDKCLADYKIQNGSTIHLVFRLSGGWSGAQLDPTTLAPRYNFDFTNVRDTGRVFCRGGEIYRRPCGWKRYALAVLGNYESDQWLGATGGQECGEWPVSYHGTGRDSVKSISEVGFQLSKGKRFAFGRGIYSTPDVDVAEAYAVECEYQGHRYKVVLQNRVNPRTLCKLGKIWLTPDELDVRPYGILVKRV